MSRCEWPGCLEPAAGKAQGDDVCDVHLAAVRAECEAPDELLARQSKLIQTLARERDMALKRAKLAEGLVSKAQERERRISAELADVFEELDALKAVARAVVYNNFAPGAGPIPVPRGAFHALDAMLHAKETP